LFQPVDGLHGLPGVKSATGVGCRNSTINQ